MVAEDPLDDPQPVAGLLADLETDVVGERADGDLRLGAALENLGLLVVPVGLGAEQQPGADGHRVDQRHADHRRDEPEHQHTAVRAAHADQQLLGDTDSAAVEFGEFGDGVENAGEVRDVDVGERVLTGGREVVGDSLGEPHRPLVRPDEVVADDRRGLVGQPVAQLFPVDPRIALVDRPFGFPGHRAETVPQVVVDVGGEVGDPVGQRLLPLGGLPAHGLGVGLGLPECSDGAAGGLRITQGGELAAQREGEMFTDDAQVGGDGGAGRLPGGRHHALAQVAVQLEESGLRIEFLVAEAQRVRTEHRRHREQRDVEARGLQMRPVGVDDGPPVRIQVGFRDQARDRRAQSGHLLEERHLRCGELLAGIGHHEHCVGRRDHAQCCCGIRVPVAADAGGVHEDQAVGQQRAGCLDLEAKYLAASGERGVGGDAGDGVHRHRDAVVCRRAVDDQMSRRLRACEMTVGTAVVSSSPTEHTSRLSRALTKELLPCLS